MSSWGGNRRGLSTTSGWIGNTLTPPRLAAVRRTGAVLQTASKRPSTVRRMPMQLCKLQLGTGEERVGLVSEGHLRLLDLEKYVGMRGLSDVLHSDDPAAVARGLIDDAARTLSFSDLTLLAPIDRQEVWAAGVTYKRSREARERESAGAGRFYDLVYEAP